MTNNVSLTLPINPEKTEAKHGDRFQKDDEHYKAPTPRSND